MISAGSVDDTRRICTSNVSCGSGKVLGGGEYHTIYIYIGALLCNVSCDSGEVLSGRDCVDHVECYLCNNQHKSDVVEIEKGQINDVLLQSGLLITQPLWEAH